MSALLPQPSHEIDELYADTPKDGNAIKQVAWLRRKIAPTAGDDAVAEAFGQPDSPPYTETLLLVNQMVKHLEWPTVIGEAAFKAEWGEAQSRVKKCAEEIRRAVWPMAKIRADDQDIISAAQKACDRSGIFVPTDLLIDLCRRIARAAVPQRVSRR